MGDDPNTKVEDASTDDADDNGLKPFDVQLADGRIEHVDAVDEEQALALARGLNAGVAAVGLAKNTEDDT